MCKQKSVTQECNFFEARCKEGHKLMSTLRRIANLKLSTGYRELASDTQKLIDRDYEVANNNYNEHVRA